MRKITVFAIACFLAAGANAQFGGFLNKVRDKAADKVSDKVSDKAADDVGNSMDKKNTESNQNNSSNQNNNQQNNAGQSNNNSTSATTAAPDPAASFKTYSNYDFVPGDTVIFADDFADDQDGEFPSHWTLNSGQGILNKVGNDEAFCLTEGNYVIVSPRMKTKSYLGSAFTVEFNYYAKSGNGVALFLYSPDENRHDVHFADNGEVATGYFSQDFSAPYPHESDETFKNKWHHAAFIYKNGQIKCYIDQYRILVMPGVTEKLSYLAFGGIGSQDEPIIFKDVRVASGGNMNMIGKKFTDAKIVTHGINFDVDKATIKPESMGTLNMIVKVMQNNPDLKFEVDGHTDNSGNAQHNMQLSQQRADAVKTQLVSMGIDGSRLTTKGFGDTMPISSNDTQEGKANNRRVEFVKM